MNRDFISDPGYYQQFRQEIVDLVPAGSGRVLEVGCAYGATLAHLKTDRGAREVIGIEYVEEVANVAANDRRLDAVHCMDIQSQLIPYPAEYFDCIIASHVLEHLQDPWSSLEKLLSHLRPGGTFVCALPNVRYLPVVTDLVLRGKFEYKPSGVLDRTHLRFFTLASMRQMLESAGLRIDSFEPEIHGLKAHVIDRISMGALRQFAAYAYNFRCVKS